MQWRNMNGEFMTAFSEIIDQLQNKIGQQLHIKGSDDGEWSEIGYWKEETRD